MERERLEMSKDREIMREGRDKMKMMLTDDISHTDILMKENEELKMEIKRLGIESEKFKSQQKLLQRQSITFQEKSVMEFRRVNETEEALRYLQQQKKGADEEN